MKSLDFDFKIYHPYNCLPALIADFKQYTRIINDRNNENSGGTASSEEEEEKKRKRFSILAAEWLKSAQRVVLGLQVPRQLFAGLFIL